MQLPEPPPPLAPLWDRVIRARALPPDLDVQLLYVAIRDRLLHPEWEVRLHALRVLADLLPLSGNALDFPFDQVVDNLGHGSPNVRKAALDALKVFCVHCEETECAARAILDKCSYNNIRPHSADLDAKVNVVTGLILSIPSVLGILKRRNPALDTFPMVEILGDKLFDPLHKSVALRSLLKLRRVFGAREYMKSFSQLNPETQEKFRIMCEMYDEDSMDVHYGSTRTVYRAIRDHNNSHMLRISHAFNSATSTPARLSTDTSSEESYFVKRDDILNYNGGFAKVIIETEIKFDADTAITMTVLEENETETESEKNLGSEEDCDSSDRNMLRYSDGESEDTDVVVSQKRVRFGGESFKIRTPDSDNITSDNINSEDDNKSKIPPNEIVKINKRIEHTSKISSPIVSTKIEEIRNLDDETMEAKIVSRKSGIPLPVIQTKVKIQQTAAPDLVNSNKHVKQKSRSLSELYDFFRTKNGLDYGKFKESSALSLTISEVRSPEKVPSPVEPHREVEVLHNLQRSPTLSPRRRHTQLQLERDGFVLNVLATSPRDDWESLSPRPPASLRPRYEWEDYNIVPSHVAEQLHNTENWISAVKAADQLHSALLEVANVKKIEPAAKSLVQHMWALSDIVSAARAPAEGAVCAVFRSASPDCARALLPVLVARLAGDPPPAALPHALLQRLALHDLVDLVFEHSTVGVSNVERMQSAQLRATLCVARSAGPAAVLAAVRRRLAGTARADSFCQKLRERLNAPIENGKRNHISRSSHLPIPVRRRARSTPSPAAPLPPRRLRPLPDSAPLPGISNSSKDLQLKRPSPRYLSDKDSSATTVSIDKNTEKTPTKIEEEKKLDHISIIEVLDDFTELEKAESPSPPPASPKSPSLRVEDCSERSRSPSKTVDIEEASPRRSERFSEQGSPFGSQRSLHSEVGGSPAATRVTTLRSSPGLVSERSVSPSPAKSRCSSPIVSDERLSVRSRDVRAALAECSAPQRHEDWEVIVSGLAETERLAADPGARAPAAAWRAAARAAAGHARSLRSRVARTACRTLGALYDHRGRALDPELEETTAALLDRCADVNRFLRGDAAAALVLVAAGAGGGSRAVTALVRRGATHRAGPVRAAAALALAELVRRGGAARALDLPPEPRSLLLRAAAEMLGDASAEVRAHARTLCLALAEDVRFRPMLKECMPPARYRAVEKNVDKLRCSSLVKLVSFLWWGGLYICSTINYPEKCAEWHSRIVTLLHGSVASIVGVMQCSPWSLSVQRLTSKCSSNHYGLMVWSWGYFAFDLLWCLVYWTESALMICHHASALISITIYMQKVDTGCTFACTLALLEISNPLLQTRWFLRNEGYEKTVLFRVVEVTYLVVFVSMRGILGSYILYSVMTNDVFDRDEKCICIVFYIVSILFIIDIFGFLSYKYKDFMDKCRAILDRFGIMLNEQQ